MAEYLMLCALTLLAGFTGKLVDAGHEHGLKLPPAAGFTLTLITWCAYGYVMTRSAILLTGFMGLVLYWIYKQAWNCRLHAIGLIIVLLFALNSEYRVINAYLVAICGAHVLFHRLKSVSLPVYWQPMHVFFYRYRIDFLLIPLTYTLFVGPQGMIVYLAFLGVQTANRIFRIPCEEVCLK